MLLLLPIDSCHGSVDQWGVKNENFLWVGLRHGEYCTMLDVIFL